MSRYKYVVLHDTKRRMTCSQAWEVLKMTVGEADNCGLAVGQKLMREVF